MTASRKLEEIADVADALRAEPADAVVKQLGVRRVAVAQGSFLVPRASP
jgi:hypothetical protein